VFLRTALLSALATALTLLVAFPVAWIIAKVARGRASSLLFVLMPEPFWVSETGARLGWLILPTRIRGAADALDAPWHHAGAVELLYHDATSYRGGDHIYLAAVMVVPLVSALRAGQLADQAAYNLGGTGPSILRQIVIPHAAPASPRAASLCSC